MTSTFLYFAYGSNMSRRRLTAAGRAPTATAVCQATITGHRLTFDKVGADGSAKADCARTGDLTDKVHGGLFEIADCDLPALDRAEGATGGNPGYRRTEVIVWTADGPKKATTYMATNKRPDLLPYPWYIQHVLTGAREFGLPADHIAAIERHPTKPEVDLAREARELSIYTCA
jgi:gamma-glutamylcyclotransferase